MVEESVVEEFMIERLKIGLENTKFIQLVEKFMFEKFMFEKFIFEKFMLKEFMVEKSRVEKSGLDTKNFMTALVEKSTVK